MELLQSSAWKDFSSAHLKFMQQGQKYRDHLSKIKQILSTQTNPELDESFLEEKHLSLFYIKAKESQETSRNRIRKLYEQCNKYSIESFPLPEADLHLESEKNLDKSIDEINLEIKKLIKNN